MPNDTTTKLHGGMSLGEWYVSVLRSKETQNRIDGIILKALGIENAE